MKKVLGIVLVLSFISVFAYAGLDKVATEVKVGESIRSLYRSVHSSIVQITNIKSRIQDYATSEQLSADDKAKLPALKTKVDTAITALNDVKSYIISQWIELQ